MTDKMTDKQKALMTLLANSLDIMSDDKGKSMNGVHKAMEDYKFLLNERTCHNCEEKLLPDGYEKIKGNYFCLSCYEAGASDE
jgi:formylmethanofuran dehydrogenase subunit E